MFPSGENCVNGSVATEQIGLHFIIKMHKIIKIKSCHLSKAAVRFQISIIFLDFKKDVVPAKPKAATASKSVGSGLGSFGRWSSKPKTPTRAVKKAPTSVFSSIFDNIDSNNDSSRAEESEKRPPIRSVLSSIFEKKKDSESVTTAVNDVTNDAKNENGGNHVTITKVFDFAGESVE